MTGCYGQADIIFLVDATNSTTLADFNSSMSFVYNVVSQLDIAFNSTHVSVLLVGPPPSSSSSFNSSSSSSSSSSTASCRAPDIELLEYADAESLLAAIDAVRQSYDNVAVNGTAAADYLSGCLRATVDAVLVEAAGSRPYVPHIVVAVTSGELIRSSYDLDAQSLIAAAQHVTNAGIYLYSDVRRALSVVEAVPFLFRRSQYGSSSSHRSTVHRLTRVELHAGVHTVRSKGRAVFDSLMLHVCLTSFLPTRQSTVCMTFDPQ
jgi:hypothetical protein